MSDEASGAKPKRVEWIVFLLDTLCGEPNESNAEFAKVIRTMVLYTRENPELKFATQQCIETMKPYLVRNSKYRYRTEQLIDGIIEQVMKIEII